MTKLSTIFSQNGDSLNLPQEMTATTEWLPLIRLGTLRTIRIIFRSREKVTVLFLKIFDAWSTK
jgi:hypothetical protein